MMRVDITPNQVSSLVRDKSRPQPHERRDCPAGNHEIIIYLYIRIDIVLPAYLAGFFKEL